MKSKLTVLALRATGHVLSAYTQRSGAGAEDLTDEQLEKRFPQGLTVRVPLWKAIGKTTAGYVAGTKTLQIANENDVGVGTRLVVHDSLATPPAEVHFRVQTGGSASPNTTLGVAPLTTSVALSSGSDVLLEFNDRLDQEGAFRIPASWFEAKDLDPPNEPPNDQALSRPLTLALTNGKTAPTLDTTTIRPSFEPLPSGVQVKLTAPTDAELPDTPVVCVMRTPDAIRVSSALIPKAAAGKPTDKLIPFPVIPDGENHFLFLFKGFRPIVRTLKR